MNRTCNQASYITGRPQMAQKSRLHSVRGNSFVSRNLESLSKDYAAISRDYAAFSRDYSVLSR